MQYKVSVIGLGFVGLSLSSFLASKDIHVIGVDYDKVKISKIISSIPPFYEPKLEYLLKTALKKSFELTDKITSQVVESDFIFICVGTPMKNNGSINLKYIKSSILELGEKLSKSKSKPIIVIKSTVVPNTSEDLVKPLLESLELKESKNFELLSNPEFLREGFAIEDTLNPHAIVIGGKNTLISEKLKKLYLRVYPKYKNFVLTNNSTAELIKYANNSFLATKISFINSIANICQKIPGTNIDDISKAIGLDPRISSQFLKAGPGYGGSCFPKDIQALISFSKNLGYVPQLLTAVHKTNDLQKDVILDIIENNLKTLKNKSIVIFGLAFKENTDDIRESVSIKLIKSLLEKNCKITVSDPKAIENTKKIFGDKISYSSNPINSIPGSDCIVILTPWRDYSLISQSQFLKMKNPLIIDTRRMLNITNKKINYISLGIGK